MTPNLARYLNKTVFVSIPVLFDHAACLPYRLLGVELNGLWLQSEELSHRLLPDDPLDLRKLAPVVFVPFAQIAGVLVPTIALAQPVTSPAAQEETPARTEADGQQASAAERPAKKGSRKR